MKKTVMVALLALALGACAPQSRVEDLEARVEELSGVINEMATLIGQKQPDLELTGLQVKIPDKKCQKPGIAVWEQNGTLGCVDPLTSHHVDGYDLSFPASQGCIGQYIIMGAESLTCETPEHPYHN
ncbi:MAG TPA: hypothetical protein VNC78_00175 [Actinomycetota bacterium]|nr:hypothetical protein [Actinomycetota bacterium]